MANTKVTSNDIKDADILTQDIANNQITYAKIQDVSATARILGRSTAGAGDIEELDGDTARGIINASIVGHTHDASEIDSGVLGGTFGGTGVDAGIAAGAFVHGSSGGELVYSATTGHVLTWQGGLGVAPAFQAPTGVADGDKGDITVSSTGTVWTIDADAVTYAKMQNVSATDKLLGRSTAGAGNVEEIPCNSFGRTVLNTDSNTLRAIIGAVGTGDIIDVPYGGTGFDMSATEGMVWFDGTGTSVIIGTAGAGKVLTDNGPGNAPSYVALPPPPDGDKGNITVSGSGAIWTIDPDVVTFAKMQNINTNKLIGRSTASSGDPEEISIGSGLSLSSGTLSAPGGGVSLGKVLAIPFGFG